MKIITILRINLLNSLFIFSSLLSFDIDFAISQALKDSINFNREILSTFSKDDPNYIFLDALIEFNGDSASKKYQKFYSKYPQHKYADYSVYEIGSYYYSKGYYINSSSWFKKIPIHYHKSALMEKSIEMFFNSMIVSGSADSLGYYGNIFSKLYPNLDIGSYSINFPYELKFENEEKDIKYTIQIGAFEQYNRAESRMYMLKNSGFSVTIIEQKKDGINFYIVREGEYSTKKSANKIAMRIKARTGLSPIIVEL